MNKKLLSWYIIPVCLFLMAMGIRVPNLSTLRPPKPSPRAVIETTNKSSQDVTTKNVIALEFFDSLPTLHHPVLFRSRFTPEICQFSSTTPPQSDARAPPLFYC
jgi:hypothetical protein